VNPPDRAAPETAVHDMVSSISPAMTFGPRIKPRKAGSITPWPVCALPECANKPEAHHPDYSAPLDVVWLCSAHHKQAHALCRKVS